jgi:hypothetical protein
VASPGWVSSTSISMLLARIFITDYGLHFPNRVNHRVAHASPSCFQSV